MNPLEKLLEAGEVTESFVRQVKETMQQTGQSLEATLIQLGIAPQVVRTLFAEYYQVPPFIIPEGSAIHYRVVPLLVEDEVLVIGVNDPENLQIREVLNFVSTKYNLAYKVVFMLEADIKKAQEFYSNLKGEVTDALSTLEGELDAEIA